LWLPLLAALLLTVSCAREAPPCPVPQASSVAPSAGCFALRDGKVLLVEGLNGKVSLPGGSSHPGEAAECTAFRETFEETGLHLYPRELLAVFSTGFYVYRCEFSAESGDIDPPSRMEVRRALYLSPERFDDYEWRFAGQVEILRELHAKVSGP
jgi:8-oxo-dGTP pyrophosphatase MutT (NUDIX family)